MVPVIWVKKASLPMAFSLTNFWVSPSKWVTQRSITG